jgi:hypothetical protein
MDGEWSNSSNTLQDWQQRYEDKPLLSNERKKSKIVLGCLPRWKVVQQEMVQQRQLH